MAKTNLQGRQVALYLEKPANSGQYTRFICADSVSLTVNTEEIEVTADCEDTDDENAVSARDYEPGASDASGSISGNIRRIDGADAAANLTAEELLDLQLSNSVLLMRFSLGTAVGAARYSGKIFFTQNTLTADRSSAARPSVMPSESSVRLKDSGNSIS